MDRSILLRLSWNLPLDVQEKTINEIASIINLNPMELLQPDRKEYWENAAKVLFIMGYPKIKDAIPGLLIWLQDINWPGATIVMEILGSLPKDIFLPYLENAVKEALNSNDDIWLENLSSFIMKFDLKEDEFSSKDIYLALLSYNEY